MLKPPTLKKTGVSRCTLSLLALMSSLAVSTCPPVAYAQPAAQTLQPDCAGAGCFGENESVTRSSGLSQPECVGSGCMGY